MRKYGLVGLVAATLGIAPGLHGEPGLGSDWHGDAPGVRRHIAAADLPAPYASQAAANFATTVPRPADAAPKVPPGFTVALFASGLEKPRAIRTAPNGDIFVSETAAGRVRVFRAMDGAYKPAQSDIFASGLDAPFGIAFYPAGADPQYIYIANTDTVIRYPYRNGDLKARGAAETIVKDIPTGGHSTRDVAFSPDGKHLYVSIGSESNDAEQMDRLPADKIKSIEAEHGPGAAWGREAGRAAVFVTSPDGSGGLRGFANGIRNCAGLAIRPGSDELWCATNERDALGDDLPPDYVTRVGEGHFYGWPWYYIGANEDPRHKGERPDLAARITVPDVLIQPHSAPLQLTFYTGSQFPAEYRGDAFVALHGSWNRKARTGAKVVRVILKDGRPTGEYEDFMTGLVVSDTSVWARPVGVATSHDGALLVSDDANGTIWRIAWSGSR